MSEQFDEDLVPLLVLPEALIHAFHFRREEIQEVCLFGNRPGILSLANVLLWLYANSNREFLSVTALPFVRSYGRVRLVVRVRHGPPTEYRMGRLIETSEEQFDWELAEDDLKCIALWIHRLVCWRWHEYDYYEAGPNERVHARVVDEGIYPGQEKYLTKYFDSIGIPMPHWRF